MGWYNSKSPFLLSFRIFVFKIAGAVLVFTPGVITAAISVRSHLPHACQMWGTTVPDSQQSGPHLGACELQY